MPWRLVSPRRLAAWLRGRSPLAGALGLGGRDRDTLAWEARRLINVGAFPDAVRVYDLMALLWPHDPEPTLGRGVAAQLEGRLDVAERAYDGVLADSPEHLHALANRAEVRLLSGRTPEARSDLARATAALQRWRAAASLRQRLARLEELARERP